MASPNERELVRASRSGGILTLTLDNPPVNVLSQSVLDALASRLAEAEGDLEVRVVLLVSAAAKAFAAGADIREMSSLDPKGARRHSARGQEVTRRIERLPLPVIAAVHGACLGGGCEVALACDFIVASEDAVFGQPEINLGIMPGWGGTRRLARRVGSSRARKWILTGRPVPAAEALAAGVVEQVVPRDRLLEAARSLAEELAVKPPLALAAAKYSVLNAIDPALDQGLAYERDLWSRLFGTRDQRAGMQAFIEKRPLVGCSRGNWPAASRGFPWSPGRPAARKGKRKKPKTSG